MSIPELRLDANEKKELASAVKGLSEVYDVAPTDKQLAWGHFASAIAGIYGTRIVAIRLRMASERAQPVNPAPKAGPAPQNKPKAGPGQIEIPGVGVVTVPPGMQ